MSKTRYVTQRGIGGTHGTLHDEGRAHLTGNTAGRKEAGQLHRPEAGILPADDLQRDQARGVPAQLRVL